MKRTIIYIVCAALLLPLSGCSLFANYREIDTLQPVQTLGLDAEADGSILVSAASGGSQAGKEPSVLACQGPTILSAMYSLQNFSAREHLFYSHTSYILLGEDMAKAGAGPVLDFVTRSVQMRTDMPLFIVRGDTAQLLVTGTGGKEYDITNALGALEENMRVDSRTWLFTCTEVMAALAESGAALACALTCMPAEAAVTSGGEGLAVLPAGYALLKDGALAGYIPEDTAIGVNFLINRVNGGSLVVEDGRGNPATLDITTGGSSLKPVYGENGRLEALEVQLHLRAALAELSAPAAVSDPACRQQLEQSAETQLIQWAQQVLELAREENADFLALGQRLRNMDPMRFTQMPESWEETLPGLDFRVTAQVEVTKTYDLQDSASTDGSGRG